MPRYENTRTNTRPARRPKGWGEYCMMVTVSLPRWVVGRVEEAADKAGISRSKMYATILGKALSGGREEWQAAQEWDRNFTVVEESKAALTQQGALRADDDEVAAMLAMKKREADAVLEDIKNNYDEYGVPIKREGDGQEGEEVEEVDANDLY